MCLGIPGKIVRKDNEQTALVDFGGVSKEINLMLLPQARIGNYVLVHAGYALQVIDEKEANETIKIFNRLAQLQADDASFPE